MKFHEEERHINTKPLQQKKIKGNEGEKTPQPTREKDRH